MLLARRSATFVWPTDAWGIGAILSLTASAHLLVALPVVRARSEFDQLAMAIVERDGAVDATRRRIEDLRAAHAEREQRLGRQVPLQPITAVNERIDAIGELAESHGLELVEFTRVGERGGMAYRTVSLRFVAQGDFADGVRFIHALHGAEPHVAATAFEVSGIAAREAPVRIGLDLRWYAAVDRSPVVQVGVDSE